MIIPNQNLIYFHPAKTGGTSIEHTLKKAYLGNTSLNWREPSLKIMYGLLSRSKSDVFKKIQEEHSIRIPPLYLQHACINFYNLLRIDFHKYTTCCSVRHPYTRLVSIFLYNAKMRRRTSEDFTTFVTDFLAKEVEKQESLGISHSHIAPQYMYVKHNDYVVNHVIRQESLNSEFKRLFGLDIISNHLNSTSTRKGSPNDYMSLYDQKTKDVVYNVYKEDFSILGYKK